ncbi:MAG TPA: dihydrolipoamide acetyltransferase family protein [Anaerolineales bacterium]|nr:dihydrolipoamide acetyltransferase family protein [Anaerolineales bacterium]
MSKYIDVIMPVLGMSQDSGKLVRWIKKSGERVEKGEPLMEVETDKATVEIEAPASGWLTQISAQEGDDIPVTRVIAVIQDESGEGAPAPQVTKVEPAPALKPGPLTGMAPLSISPLAARIAAENHLDPSQIKPNGGRIEKADVLAYLGNVSHPESVIRPRRILASPKARRLAKESGLVLADLHGSGPEGAILAVDVLSIHTVSPDAGPALGTPVPGEAGSPLPTSAIPTELPMSTTWARMIERISASWPATPHFYLVREVNASRMVAWGAQAQAQNENKITVTDLLVRLCAAALAKHPRINAQYHNGKLLQMPEVNIGLAVAVEEGLVVPVIKQADRLSLSEVAAARKALVERARAGKLRLEDMQGGTFTISNLGMYDIDAFNAMINPPQAAILAVGRIADRVVAVNGQPAVQPMLTLSVSFDHRVVDGARGAEFLKTLAEWIEEPLALLH